MMNTKIHYIYRDAANFKIHLEEVVKGTAKAQQIEDMFEDCVVDEFYPEKIGFRSDTFETIGYARYDDDPDFHEIIDIEPVADAPTVDMTIEDFLEHMYSVYGINPTKKKRTPKRKFAKGDHIVSLDDLAHEEYIYYRDKVVHRGWFLSWQMSFVSRNIGPYGHIYYAEKIEAEGQ